MWAAKVDGEGGKLVQACDAMCDVMKILGIAVDGGKDSLSMAARCKNNETVCSPGTLVVSSYAPCPNIQKVITPDFKVPGSYLVFICFYKVFFLKMKLQLPLYMFQWQILVLNIVLVHLH